MQKLIDQSARVGLKFTPQQIEHLMYLCDGDTEAVNEIMQTARDMEKPNFSLLAFQRKREQKAKGWRTSLYLPMPPKAELKQPSSLRVSTDIYIEDSTFLKRKAFDHGIL